MRITALGRLIIVHPSYEVPHKWYCVSADKNGNWKSFTIHDTKRDANEHRTKLFTLHRKLAKEYAHRKRQ